MRLSRRRLAGGLLAVVLATGLATGSGLALTGCAACSDPVPAGFQPLATQLRGFDAVEFDLAWESDDRPGRTRGTLRASADGQLELKVPAMELRLTYGPQGARLHGTSAAMPLPSLNPYIQDGWEEFRGGFADSTWRAADAPSGLLPGRTWSTLRLPFDWARELTLWLAVNRDGDFTDLVIETDQPPLAVTVNMIRGGARTATLSTHGRLWVTIEAVRWSPAGSAPPAAAP